MERDNRSFVRAACGGDVAFLGQMIAVGQSVNVLHRADIFSEPMTPLHAAINKGQTAAALFLIEAGADVNQKDGFGDPPLFEAIYRNNSEVLRKLLEKGADPNGQNDRKSVGGSKRWTALEVAWQAENHEMMVQLIAAGARPVVWNQRGEEQPVLMLVVDQGHFDLAERMIKCGADGTVMNDRGETAATLIARENDRKAAQAAHELTLRTRGLWERTSGDEVSRTKQESAVKRILKDVFNFRTRERVSAFVDPASGKVEAMAITGFDDMKDKTLLEEALEEFQKQGGTADRSVLRGPVLRRDKRPLLPERK